MSETMLRSVATELEGPRIPDEIAQALVSSRAYGHWEDIQEKHRWLRENMPLGVVDVEGFDPFWFVSKHADIVEIGKNAAVFPNNSYRTALLSQSAERGMFEAREGDLPPFVRSLVAMDGTEHRTYRGLTFSDFAPKNIRDLADHVRALARETVDAMAQMDGRCDFATDIALRYPLRVIMGILGVPREDEELLLRMTQEYFNPQDTELGAAAGEIEDGRPTAHEALYAVADYFKQLTDHRRAHPTDDIASTIANSNIDGQPISYWDATSYYITVATAGHDTTSSSTSGAIWALAERPDDLERLKADRSLIPTLVDEAVRWTSPLIHFMRTAADDHVLREQNIRKGDWLMLSYPSANRDEDVFESPFEFRIDRRPNNHVGFGFGPHVCLGQHLARLEMSIFFEELLDRLDSIELDGQPSRTQSIFVGGVKSVPIRFNFRR